MIAHSAIPVFHSVADSIGESVPLYHSNRYHHITLIGTTVSLESVPTTYSGAYPFRNLEA